MRIPAMVYMATILSLAAAADVSAAPLELVCKSSFNEIHLYIDLDAGTVDWNGQTFQAQITDTQVHWSGIVPKSPRDGQGPDIDATLDRDTGTLVVRAPAGSDPDTGYRWGPEDATWTCVKAQKIF